ncbi:MAG TPA: hypothetical protein EYQ14_12360 [Gammaproteobacteria bacterium]|nr:hypothetical protein [Gammaproteobacteria bacterium]HIL96788.1 hypothetical protein [Pseudomonadales bacterium]
MTILDSHTLIRAQRDVQVPFELRVRQSDDRESIVKFLKIERLLPGKRIVAMADCDGQRILVKTFLGRTANRYAAQERFGVSHMIDAGVRTPRLLWQAELVDGPGQMLAFQYIDNSLSLQDRWDRATEDYERVDVLTRAMIIIAQLHNQGVVQTDIHLANFLMSKNKIYTIDGGGIVRDSVPPLREDLSLKNLSWFFAQFFPKFDEFVQIVFPAYETVRGWSADPDRVISLHEKVTLSREARKKHYLDKAFRDCTRFVCQSSLSRFMVCERSAYNDDLAALLKDPDKFMANGLVLKDGNSATVTRVKVSGRTLVVKRYNIKNPWHGLLRAFQKSRAWLSWSNAFHMEFLGIRSLRPIAMLENRLGPIRSSAYFITEYIEGPDVLDFLGKTTCPNGELEALVLLLSNLSESKISHGDMKATNFLMAEEGPIIIDLDAMRQHKSRESFDRAFEKDLERFMQNWEGHPELESRFEGLLSKLSQG